MNSTLKWNCWQDVEDQKVSAKNQLQVQCISGNHPLEKGAQEIRFRSYNIQANLKVKLFEVGIQTQFSTF